MLFSFRIRSPERDQATDQSRFDELLQSIHKAISAVERESNGLRARAEGARASASFALEALDDDHDNVVIDERIRALTDTLLRCEQRLEQLDRQARFLDQLFKDVLDFRSDDLLIHQPALNNRTASSLPNR